MIDIYFEIEIFFFNEEELTSTFQPNHHGRTNGWTDGLMDGLKMSKKVIYDLPNDLLMIY